METRVRHRPGFTLVELLVVIAIIGVLVGLLLPAVQAAREAARRASCQNNLKNIALAVINFVDIEKQYPIGVAGGDPTKSDTPPVIGEEGESTGFCEKGFGWVTYILPFLEEQALHDHVWDDTGVFLNPGQSFPFPDILRIGPVYLDRSGKNTVWRGGETELPIFRCPSSELESRAVGHVGELAWMNGYATSDYKGNGGNKDQGVFQNRCDNARARLERLANGSFALGAITKVRPENITDGLTQTILLGESSYYVVEKQSGQLGPKHWPIWMGGGSGDENTIFKTERNTPINCDLAPKSKDNFSIEFDGNSVNLGPVDNDCAFSWHAGGAFFAFCDGSVHYLDETIDQDVYMNLGSRNDGNIVNGY